jgi:hypothetical protein
MVAFIGWNLWIFFHGPRRDVTEVCISNVRQSGTALLMYVQDYDERLPAQPAWMDVSWPYMKNEALLKCPEVRRSSETGYGYAFNRSLLGKKVGSVPDLSDVPMVYDSSVLDRNACAGPSSLPRPPRHDRQRYNVVIHVDGHALGVSLTGERKPPEFFKGSSMGGFGL